MVADQWMGGQGRDRPGPEVCQPQMPPEATKQVASVWPLDPAGRGMGLIT